jgi:hypothetical protein
LAGQVPRHHDNQEDHQAIGEAVATGRVGGDGGILDGRVLDTINLATLVLEANSG